MNKEEIAIRTKLAREMAGYSTRKAMAEVMGIGAKHYSTYERGHKMGPRIRKRFCEATNINEEWYLTGLGEMRRG